MKIIKTKFLDLKIIKLKKNKDTRGNLVETFRKKNLVTFIFRNYPNTSLEDQSVFMRIKDAEYAERRKKIEKM